ncbi:MAG TPA: DUF1284 domain-containing protein [Eubacteriales bacterium]|nr:DUF1284 domain-containing protein [Eubacteriales bacterium]
MIKLRPHHILCARFYKSVGYSKEFVSDMDKVVAELKNNPNQFVDIVLSEDDICRSCPNNVNGCITAEKVNKYDSLIIKKLGIEIKKAKWKDLHKAACKIKTINELSEICGDCEWFYICKQELE